MNINDLQLRELHRFAELGRLSANLLHEITNPLSAALLNLEMSDKSSPAVRKARRNMQLLSRYVEAARQQIRNQSQATSFLLQTQIKQLKSVLLPLAKQARVRLEFCTLPVGYKLHGDPVKFQQIIANLVVNAVQAYSEGPAYYQAAQVRIEFIAEPDCLIIKVTDWGRGIGGSEMPKLFDLFYTTKDSSNQGLGLGLAIVKQYVTVDFGGSIRVCSSGRSGTQFMVKLKSLPE